MSCIHFHITFYILLFFVTTVQWCDQLTSVCCGGDGLTAPQNTIGPSRNAAFFARVKIIAKQIVLVRRYEVGRTLVEAVKNLRPQNAIKNQKKMEKRLYATEKQCHFHVCYDIGKCRAI